MPKQKGGFASFLKSCDIYRRLPKDMTEPTVSGATISLVCSALMLLLFMSETAAFFTPDVKTDMQVDVSQASQRISINMDIDFPYIPCYVLSLDVQDIVGTHIVDFEGTLIKSRMDDKGKVIESWNHGEKHIDDQKNIDDADQAFN